MKNGTNHAAILKAAREARRGLPPKFAEIEETTEPWMGFFISAFFELSTERPVGFGLGPIPWSKITKYGESYGFEGSDLALFHDIVRSMDAHYIAQKERETKNGTNPGPISSKDGTAREAS